MNNESTNTIICRKCGGPHFTIKCGKDKTDTVIPDKSLIQNSDNIPVETIKEDKHNFYEKSNKHNKYHSKITYRVKLSELPSDMTDEEMMELTCDWGHIIKIRVINYNENSVAYIDFGFEDEAIYFIEAIDKTPFESLLLSAVRVES